MKKITKLNKKYALTFILFILILICYNFRFQIMYNVSTALGYNENKAKRYSFIFSEKPFQIASVKLRNYFSPWQADGMLLWQAKEEFNIALNIKKNFTKFKSPKLDFKDGNYFLNIFKSAEIKDNYKNSELEYTDVWKNNKPLKVWSLDISNEILSEESSTKKLKKLSDESSDFLQVQSSPKICDGKLIYAKNNGIIAAVDYKTGKTIWHKKYGKIPAFSIRGFYCDYEKILNTYIAILPTGAGVYCLDVADGSLIKSRCGGGQMGVFESRVSPLLFDNIVYIATIDPAGLEAYNFLTGKFLWRADFQIGKFFYGGGANPWSNFVIDHKKKLLFVNTGSPSYKYTSGVLEKYKYSGSLIAIDSKTGNIVSQFQEHETGDTWNHDFVGQPILSPIKINGKDIVITLSKSGSVYFLDRNNGLPVLPVNKETINFGDFKYDYKRPVLPKSLMNTDYYNYYGNICNDCDLNTTIFGTVPPVLKFKRVFDGAYGGPQWPAGSIDMLNKYLILPSNDNAIQINYDDYVPEPLLSLPKNKLINQCTSCHNNKGAVNFRNRMIIPSLFLTTKIYDSFSLNQYLKNNNFHKNLNFKEEELLNTYEALNKYDTKLINKNQYKRYTLRDSPPLEQIKDMYPKRLSGGKITAISLNTGEIVWQIPAGTYKISNSELIMGSQSAGGITDGGNEEGVSFFTGSFDNKVYAIRNKDGKYLWKGELSSAGSAPPLVYNTTTERWIFVLSGGYNFPYQNRKKILAGAKSKKIVAFKQKLN